MRRPAPVTRRWEQIVVVSGFKLAVMRTEKPSELIDAPQYIGLDKHWCARGSSEYLTIIYTSS